MMDDRDESTSTGTGGSEPTVREIQDAMKKLHAIMARPYAKMIHVRPGEYELIKSGAKGSPLSGTDIPLHPSKWLPDGVLYQVFFSNGDIEMYAIDGTITSIRLPPLAPFGMFGM